jgi:hypothetical protein
MIVLDENLSHPNVRDVIAKWYAGKVVIITGLRLDSRILDDAIPMLLRQQKQPTFVTTNEKDFWRRVPANQRYCIICLPLPNKRQEEMPDLLRRLFRLPDFKTKSVRMGKVARVSEAEIQFYQAGDETVRFIEWE